MRWPSLRIFFDAFNRTVYFSSKFFSGNRAAFKVPINCRLVLGRSSFEKFGWLLAMTELGSDPVPHFIRGDGLGFAGIKLLNAPGYLVVPGVLSRRLIHLFKAIDERARKGCALIGWQG
ncbi:MAG TPA: hypothetical protein VGJ30_13820 [Candidatus Angelobacter sp.]|jgi:hypothetical protein